ncbi:hypothetical protein J3R83DRAFT_901 [Lanmaoa asiatica]|nr:hypothetical protein J3R83DRAFT_901 [Lanmaoa asiatica]
MLQIEWKSSHYHSNGRRRSRPKASTVHGWLVKWRATFSGNERLRKEGIREMREAKAVRELKKQQRAARQAKTDVPKYFFRLWPISLGKKVRQLQAPKGLSRGAQHSSKPPSRESTRRLTHSPRPTPTHSRRSSHNRQGTGDRTHSSRKASHNSRRDIVRAAEKKR